MDNKVIFAILGIIVLLVGLFIFSSTPSLEITNFHGEKQKTVINYVSGKTEDYITLSFKFNIVSSNAVDKGIKYSCLGYDNNGNLIINETNDCGVIEGEQEFSYSDKDMDMWDFGKIKKIELYIYEYGDNFNDPTDHGKILYHGVTENIKKCEDKIEEMNDTIDWSGHKSSKSTSKNIHDSYSTDSDYSVYGDYIGNSKTHKFHQSFCSWADNIKSGNIVTFSSRQDAIDSGYSPCSYCNP